MQIDALNSGLFFNTKSNLSRISRLTKFLLDMTGKNYFQQKRTMLTILVYLSIGRTKFNNLKDFRRTGQIVMYFLKIFNCML